MLTPLVEWETRLTNNDWTAKNEFFQPTRTPYTSLEWFWKRTLLCKVEIYQQNDHFWINWFKVSIRRKRSHQSSTDPLNLTRNHTLKKKGHSRSVCSRVSNRLIQNEQNKMSRMPFKLIFATVGSLFRILLHTQTLNRGLYLILQISDHILLSSSIVDVPQPWVIFSFIENQYVNLTKKDHCLSSRHHILSTTKRPWTLTLVTLSISTKAKFEESLSKS